MDVQLDHSERIRQLEKELAEKDRELSIESALEKVRVCAMAMNEAKDMLEVCRTISLQLESLGVKEIRNVQTAIFYIEKGTYMNYEYYAKHKKTFITETTHSNNEIHNAFAQQMLKGKGESFHSHIKKSELKAWLDYQRTTNVFIDDHLKTATSLDYYWFSLGEVALGISTYIALADHELALFKRFLNVFELAFRRHLDIEKAETQAREARIEAALERVRGRTMAMHQTSELQEVIHTLHKELLDLNLSIDGGSFVVINDDIGSELRCWGSGGTANTSEEVRVPDFNMRFCTDLMKGIKKGPGFFSEEFSQKEKKEYFTKLFKHKPWSDLSRKQKEETLSSSGGYTRSVAVSKHTSIFIINHQGKKFTETEDDILKRFANVFEQTYTRFLDLQKAETQAKEARIETALEKVRSRSLAMHRSEELAEVVTVVFDRLLELDIETDAINLDVFSENNIEDAFLWTAVPGHQYSKGFHIPFSDSVIFKDIYKGLTEGKDLHAKIYSKQEKDEFFTYLFTNTEFRHTPEERKKMLLAMEGYSISVAYAKHIAIIAQRHRAVLFSDEENDILKRFAKVFEQSYTRFLDLQKAEAQAREAQIEAALEKVRSRSIGMHKSDELLDVIRVVSDQLSQVKIRFHFVSFGVITEDLGFDFWLVSPGFVSSERMHAPYMNNPIPNTVIEAKKSGVSFFSNLFTKEENKPWLQLVLDSNKSGQIPESAKEYMLNSGFARSAVVLKNIFVFLGNYIPKPYTDEENEILIRFANVFEQSYTRFLDLQKAEAQAREAQIQLALERVRARTMAMQKSDELQEAANLLFQQVQSLGMSAWSAGYCIWNEDKSAITLFMSSEGVLQPPFNVPTTEDELFIQMREGQSAGKAFHVVEMGGDRLVKHYQYMRTLPVVGEVLDSIIAAGHPLPSFQIMHHAYFSQGFLLFITYEPVPEAHDIFKRFSNVFDQTYTRFLDLQKAEALTREAELEKKRSEDLLLNILPREIANELKLFGKSYARKHEQVTVLFTDIKNFSIISETLSAEELVNQLDECFRAFDNIVGKHGLEKIKTIGDAYVCACGLPNPDPDNAVKTVRAALDMLDFSKGFAMTKTIQDLPAFEFRFGINTGRVVTGVVGLKKFTYDIWGDAVNMAARMEQHGEPNKINISGSTYALVKEKFNCTHRGKIAAKNKGEVDMYFVEGMK